MIALAAAVAGAADPLPIRELASGLLVVPVEIDGANQTFILDTGAGITAITPRTASLLGVGDDEGRAVTARAVGGDFEVRLVRLDAFDVGGVSFPDLRVAVVDLAAIADQLGEPVDGILGRNFFLGADVAIDADRQHLRLYPAGGFDRTDIAGDLARVRFRRVEKGLVGLHARLGELDVDCVLDLGSNSSITNQTTSDRAGGEPGERRAMLMGADGRPIPVRETAFPALAIGEVVIPDPVLGVCEDFLCASLLGRGKDRVHLGIDVLDGRSVVFSYRDRAMWLSRE